MWLARSLQQRVLNGGFPALAIIFARVLQNANGFILTALVARLYGFDAVGTLVLATIPNTFVALFGTFGLQFRFAQIDATHAVRNSLGLIAAIGSFPVIALLSVVFALAVGHSDDEQFQLIVLAISSPFFAQANLTCALQVLQNKQTQSIIAPALNSIGLLVGAFFADFNHFCLCILVFRLLGIALPYALLPHDLSALRFAPRQLWAGMHYLVSDAVILVGENLVLLLTSHLLGRSELGVLGICRQLLTASDTPGWANLQSVYPKLVAEDEHYFHSLVRSMALMGAVLGLAVAVMAFPAGLLVFGLPDLWFYAAILMASVPARYVVVSIETYLKAKHAIGFANRLTAARAIAGFCVIGGATFMGGMLGHIIALAGFFAAFALLECFLTMRGGQVARPVIREGQAL
jgi:O-antigen/teichoic acid export membrane protein